MRDADEKLRDIASGREARLAIGVDITRNLFYVAVGVAVVLTLWGAVSGFVGLRSYALGACVLAAVVLKIGEKVLKEKLA